MVCKVANTAIASKQCIKSIGVAHPSSVIVLV